MDFITLDAPAEDNGLALMLRGLLEENLAASQPKREDFASIRTCFALIAPDAEVEVSLWFEGGRCTLYNGVRAGTEVTITADSGKIPELSLLSFRFGLPWLLDDAGKEFLRAFALREIAITGLIDLPLPHPLRSLRRVMDMLRLVRALSVSS